MKVEPGYKQTEAGIIPEQWTVAELQQVCQETITYGIVQCGPHVENGVPYIRVSDMDGPELDFAAMLRTAPAIAAKFARSTVEEGDIVYALRGKLGEVRLVGREVAGANLTQGTARLSPKQGVASVYLLWALRSSHSLRQAILGAKGTTFREITLADLRRIKVPIPTAAEQQAIAEALSDADALIESLEQLLAKKRQIKQGAMQELLTGKKRLSGFSGGWETKRISDLAALSRTGINPASNPDALFVHFSLPSFDADGVPVSEQGRLIGSNKFIVPPNAVLLSKLNPRIPRIWTPSHVPDNAVCSTEFLVLVPRDEVDRNFLSILCKSSAVRYQMELHATGTTGSHQRISPAQALAIEVGAPKDKAEQAAIAERLGDLEEDIAVLEAKLRKCHQIKQGMMQELLTGRIRLV